MLINLFGPAKKIMFLCLNFSLNWKRVKRQSAESKILRFIEVVID